MKWVKKVIKIQIMVYKCHGWTFLCVQREWEKVTALKLRIYFVCRQKELSVSLLTYGCVIICEPRLSSDEKATSQNQQHARECSQLPSLSAVLGHFRCEPPLPSCASEMLLESLKVKNSKWVQKGIWKSISSIKAAYVRIVFILAHGVLKCNLQSERTINTGFDWSS